jgi:hypothetical protein
VKEEAKVVKEEVKELTKEEREELEKIVPRTKFRNLEEKKFWTKEQKIYKDISYEDRPVWMRKRCKNVKLTPM